LSALSAGGYRAGRIGAARHVRPASRSADRFAARVAADGDARRDRRRRLHETATRELTLPKTKKPGKTPRLFQSMRCAIGQEA